MIRSWGEYSHEEDSISLMMMMIPSWAEYCHGQDSSFLMMERMIPSCPGYSHGQDSSSLMMIPSWPEYSPEEDSGPPMVTTRRGSLNRIPPREEYSLGGEDSFQMWSLVWYQTKKKAEKKQTQEKKKTVQRY